MRRIHGVIVAALVLGAACSGVHAGDFMPRAGNALAAVGDDAAPRAAAAMSEPESDAPAAPVAPAVSNTPRAARIGAGDIGAEARTGKAADDDHAAPPAPAHKARTLRWQSLLPGVMK